MVSVELLGVTPEGGDQLVDGLTVLRADGDRLVLGKRTDVFRELRGGDDVRVTRQRWSFDGVRAGTRVKVMGPSIAAFSAVVVRGYSQRLSLVRGKRVRR